MNNGTLFGFFLATLVVSLLLLTTLWRRKVLRSALALDEARLRTMGTLRILNLRASLAAYLTTQEGETLSEDPRVIARLALFDDLLDTERQRRALAYTGLESSERQGSE